MVSLDSIVGIRMSDMMQVPIYIQGCRLVALLDSGLTHTFIHRDVMRRIQLTSINANLRVLVANGDHILCGALARDLPMIIGKEAFTINCFSIDLGSYDLVLGVDLLKALGPILWDLEGLCMAFVRHGRWVSW